MPKLAQRDDEICHYRKSQVISGLDSKHSVSAPAIRQGSAGREFSLPGGVEDSKRESNGLGPRIWACMF